MKFDEIVALKPGTVIAVVTEEGRLTSLRRFLGVEDGRFIEISTLWEDAMMGFYTPSQIIDGPVFIRKPTREEIETELSKARRIVEVLEDVGVASSSCQES